MIGISMKDAIVGQRSIAGVAAALTTPRCR
jgi:hypothetical protein